MPEHDADLGRNLTVAGRTLTAAEFEHRTDLVPEKMEWDGGIFTSDRDRLRVLAMLLELMGTGAAVGFGPLEAWEAALASRRAAGAASPSPLDALTAATMSEVRRVAGRVAGVLSGFAGPRGLGTVSDEGGGIVTFVRAGRPSGDDGRPPDLMAVVVSRELRGDDNTYRRQEAVRLAGGTVWTLLLPGDTVQVSAGGQLRFVDGPDSVDAEPMLPGFSCPADALFGTVGDR